MNDSLPDAIGWDILEALQGDARLSFNELARRVGVSAPTVAERVRRMEEAGIITGYRAMIDPAKVGLPLFAVMRIVTPVEQYARFTQAVGGMPEVVECHRVTGSDSFIMLVRVGSMEHLERFIDQLMPFGQSETSIVLSTPITGRCIERPATASTSST